MSERLTTIEPTVQPSAPIRPRVLFLSHRFPYPAIGGDRVKAFHLIRHLAKISQLDVIALDEAGTASDVNRALMTEYGAITTVPFSKREAAMRLLKALPSSTPLEFAYYHDARMQEAVDQALGKNHYDLVICFFLRTAEYLVKHDVSKILIAEDARIILEERATDRFSFSPEYFVRKIDVGRLRKYEPRAMSQGFSRVTFVSKIDERRMLDADPNLPTSILSNGVDLERFAYNEGERLDRLVFFGHLGVYHNILMATRLLRDIYPKIHAVSPKTKLAIVGQSPAISIERLVERSEGATLYPTVEDVRPFLRSSSVFVHAQSVGAGIQNKLLEAMAIGLPIVTTPIGASGVAGLEDNVHALVRTTDAEIVEAALSLLKNEERAKRLARNARALVEAQYSWDKVFTDLDRLLMEVAPQAFQRKAVAG